jgi:hypothetical protein
MQEGIVHFDLHNPITECLFLLWDTDVPNEAIFPPQGKGMFSKGVHEFWEGQGLEVSSIAADILAKPWVIKITHDMANLFFFGHILGSKEPKAGFFEVVKG